MLNIKQSLKKVILEFCGGIIFCSKLENIKPRYIHKIRFIKNKLFIFGGYCLENGNFDDMYLIDL